MKYLHTMLRVSDLELNLNFFCKDLGLVEISRSENEKGQFTLIFLASPEDHEKAKADKAPLIELTYNWPNEFGEVEQYKHGRAFGHLAFRVEDIYKTCSDLQQKGITIHRPPRDGYMAFIKSPEGISIELLQKGDRLPVSEPWVSMENTGSW